MKILIVCESSFKRDSGGRAARYLAKILKEGEHQTKLLALKDDPDVSTDSFYTENDVSFLPLRQTQLAKVTNIFFNTTETRRFKQVINTFKPDVIHFASFDNNKPPRFYSEAIKSGATVVMQPWTMQFFCEQGFAFRDEKKCDLCAGGNYLNAIQKKCTDVKGLPSLLKKSFIHKRALKADVFLSSNSELDAILVKYGVPSNKIFRFTVPFDYTSLIPPQLPEHDYTVFYGQSNAHKGLNVLLKVFKLLPHIKLKLFPMAALPVNVANMKNIETVIGATWSTSLPEQIASSKMVLIPSLWSTSTEYAMCEALLFKKPVVAFNVGVHKHIFKNGVNAMVVEPDDVEGYANAIKILDENADLRKQIAQNGYSTLLEVNNPVTLYPQLIKAYDLKTE